MTSAHARRREKVWHVPEDFSTLGSVVGEATDCAARHDLCITRYTFEGSCKQRVRRVPRTVELIAAGTFAIIDITGLRFNNIKI